MPLDAYRGKRDFQRTPEPRGAAESTSPGPEGRRFVVQKHAATRLHYDFRLELDGVLVSWAVPKGPSLDPSDRRLAMRTEDHPLDYRDFEGVIPESEYGGGTVLVWDRGYWIPEHDDPAAALAAGRLDFRLEGEKLRGRWRLVRMAPREGEGEGWLLIKRSDGAAERDGASIVEARPRSVLSGRDLEAVAAAGDRVWHSDGGEAPASEAGGGGEDKPGGEGGARPGPPGDPSDVPGARRGPLPEDPRPALATLVSEPPEGEGWLHEIKLDGYRLLGRIEEGRARLLTRGGNDWTDRFPGIAEAAAALPCRDALLDGEAVVLDRKGISDFQALQNAIGERPEAIVFFAFDLLHLDGWDLTAAPLRARKDALRLLLAAAGADGPLLYGDHVDDSGARFYREACRMGVEGIVCKRADAPYRPRRTRDWLKAKCLRRQEFVIVGFTEPAGSRVGLGALLLGVHEDGDGGLVGAGKVGTGFTEKRLRSLRARLEPLERSEPPIIDPPRGAKARGVHWVEPALVAEVDFAEWTADGSVRHAAFRGLREDKDPAEVVRERPERAAGGPGEPADEDGQAGGGRGARSEAGSGRSGRGPAGPSRVAGVRLTNPGRVLWPDQGVTKRELAEYYAGIADHVLPHLMDRPLTLLRCPSGRHEDCFFQKHANRTVSETIPRVRIEEDREEPYMYVDGLPALLSLVQLGVLELHVWGSRVDRLDRPDRLVFDLDPGRGTGWPEVAAAAHAVRDRLAELGLRSFLKSTGGKGLHVVVPIVRRSDWNEAKGFAHAVAREFARREPDRYTAKLPKAAREGRVFIDYLRNGWNATAIAPYSARARAGAPVAAPLAWEELEAAEASGEAPRFTIRDLPARVAAQDRDPWAEMEGLRQSITVAMRREVGAGEGR